MAKKYKLNINGSPVQNVNFNGSAWTGPLVANGVDVSYEDAPVVPPPPPIPQPDTVWKFSAAPKFPFIALGVGMVYRVGRGPLDARSSATSSPVFRDCYPAIEVSGNLIRAVAHVEYGASPPIAGWANAGNLFVGLEQAYNKSSGWHGAWKALTQRNPDK